ncbi:MAG TPA: hypothetical protein VGL93_10605 [Streptosporangiaceae bacterium]|jgi:hypothetical protein
MLTSIVRTVVPMIVGVVIVLAARAGLHITGDTSVTEVVTLGVSSVYYLAVRLLEKVRPYFGWLLGKASQPVYVAARRNTAR